MFLVGILGFALLLSGCRCLCGYWSVGVCLVGLAFYVYVLVACGSVAGML